MDAINKKDELRYNRQLKKWQKKQLLLVRKGFLDNGCPLNEYESSAWERIANATSYKEINWLVWEVADRMFSRLK